MRIKSHFIVTASLSIAFIAGCQNEDAKPLSQQHTMHGDDMQMTAMQAATMPAEKAIAVALLKPSTNAATQPTMNNVKGTIVFTQVGNSVKIVADVTGLPPNSTHGFHIHEKGDLSAPDLMSTGGHYNPEKHIHGGPTTSPVHAGDFGNLVSDASGTAHTEMTVDDITVGGAKNDILGKAVVVHAKADDLSSQPAGNAGTRVAGGLIELKK